MPNQKALTSGALSLFLGLLPVPGLAAPGVRVKCDRRIELESDGPKHISSLVWVERSQTIAVVDPFLNATLFYDLSGARDWSEENSFSSRVKSPFEMKVSGSGFIVTDVKNNFYSLSKALDIGSAVFKAKDTEKSKDRDSAKWRLGGLKAWGVAGDHLVAFGPLSYPARGDDEYGFFEAPLANTFQIKNLTRPGAEPRTLIKAERDYYRAGTQFAASTGSRVYFLVPRVKSERGEGGKSQIWEYSFNKEGISSFRFLADLPAGYEYFPRISAPMMNINELPFLFAELETFKMPVSLVAQGDLLHMVVREPLASGLTRWKDVVFDVRKGQWLTPIDLQTSAHHLQAVSAGDSIVFFEGGTPALSGKQNIRSMLLCSVSDTR